MVEVLDIDGYTFDKDVLRLALEEYEEFKATEEYKEAYKWEIFEELNNWFEENEINVINVVEFVEFLKEKNPQSGSFVHWSQLDDLYEFAKENPKELTELFDNLYQGQENLEDRLANFREKTGIGTPAFGYLLAAYDFEEYAPIKVDQFRDFINHFADQIPSKIGSLSVPQKYVLYHKYCHKMLEFLEKEGIVEDGTTLDAQDFYYTLESYDEVNKEKIFLEHIWQFCQRFDEFESNLELLIEEINSLPIDFLKSERDSYEDSEKVNKIRYLTLDKLIEDGDVDIEKIETEVNSAYAKNILQAWTSFTIYSQIYWNYFSDRLNKYFESIGQFLINNIGTEGLEYHIVSFQGSRGRPTVQPWMLIYPEEKGDHRDSYQFFFRVLPEKIEYGFSHGENIEDSDFEEKYVGKITEIDENSLEQIVANYNKFLDEFKELNGIESEDEVEEEILIPEDINFWQISPGKKRYGLWPVLSDNDLIVIGWGKYGKLGDKEDIKSKFSDESRQDVKSANILVNKINDGDILIAKKGRSKEIYGIGVVKDDYFHDSEKAVKLFGEDRENYANFRPVEWVIDLVNKYGERVEVDLEKEFVFRTAFELGNEPERYYKIKEDLVNRYPELESQFTKLERLSRKIRKGVPPEEPGEEKNGKERLLDKNNDELDFDLDEENITEGLHFPDEIREDIEKSLISALKSGKHIILTGPPGTGKTKLAENVSEAMKKSCDCVDDYIFTTATADWTTFDTMGGYQPSKEDGSLEFNPGQFLKCFKEDEKPVNKWLIIDEINRADIDKAFGQLFSVLSKDKVELPFTDDEGKSISVEPLDDEIDDDFDYSDSDYYVASNWRLLATMNTFDKASLYEMSYAFMRRFAFIDVGVPTEEFEENDELINDYIGEWDDIKEDDFTDDELGDLTKVWKVLNEGKRSIGPAIIKDMLMFLKEYDGKGGLVNALKLYVLPQLEGMVKQNQKEIFKELGEKIGYKEELEKVAKERFEIEIEWDENE